LLAANHLEPTEIFRKALAEGHVQLRQRQKTGANGPDPEVWWHAARGVEGAGE